ncbi:RsmB/NOP family class I SAM-dependent RNA methyltransferase [Oleidesulfovibrio sp.]|uniref:RsmB/NOP family class I SAM-dependent RNA methyltransferase n=1 Tax=Oleidesulfovibrio sp. TaxID=2909707 RepID=UPI003A84D3D1
MADSNPVRSFRIVCPAGREHLVEALLRSQGYDFEPEPISPWVRRLTHEPRPLGSSIAAFFGLIYIQDRSSMLPPLALAPEQGAAVLDMCASPGSKTGFLAQLTGPDGFVMGNEPNPQRLATLRQNLFTLNLPHTATCSYSGETLPLPDGMWRRIQLDPPCSGWGTVDKNPNVLKLWKGDKVKPLVGIQRLLLKEAARLLAPGGVVVYSTCTTNIQENEEQVRWAVEELGLVPEPVAPFEGFVFEDPLLPGCEGTLRVNPACSSAQGFYIARFRKEGSPATPPAASPLQVLAVNRRSVEAPCADSNLLPDGEIALFGNNALFLPRQALTMLPSAFRWRGYPLGKAARGEVRLSPRLHCMMPDMKNCPQHAINVDDPALLTGLLSGQSIDLSADEHLGRNFDISSQEAGVYFKGLPLGRLRVKGRRALWTER